MPPGTWFPMFCEQTPMLMLPPVAAVHLTVPVAPPQHSLSLVQKLSRILQPIPGWQTFTPVRAQGPQFLLQHEPHPLQSTPSWVQVPVPLVVRFPQTPTVAPAAFEQRPPQQSPSRTQTSPGWMQKEDPSVHVPPEQSPEQQPPAGPLAVEQAFPAVRQAVLSGWQVPPLQVPLQQADEAVQVAWSARQAPAAHTPRVVSHCRLQQSVAAAQGTPAPPQVDTDDAHLPVAASQE
jgi:hypothetical protein